MRPNSLWLLAFGIWAILLSGALNNLVGPPGILQAVRLRSLLSLKQARALETRAGIEQLRSDAELLEKSHAAQEHEIRRVLGYAAPDELIFDFSSSGESL
jgi:hypothetical protein